MSYVRKGAGLNTTQLRPCFSRDLIFLQIQTHDLLPLNIINLYNAPVGGTDAGAAIASLMDVLHSLWRSVRPNTLDENQFTDILPNTLVNISTAKAQPSFE